MSIARNVVGLGILAVSLLTTSVANADCVCRCTNGENVPLCNSTLDLPPICPPTICPIEPPSIAPIQAPQMPPLGTQNCWQQQVFNPYTNQYEWRRVCR
ncbi:MAG: hypothetical protein K8R50_00425 [Betaproteobacteria bacterium]|nr:hypothetical protein [Betaproteobacteria bacterium]MCX7195212.1 hypothetical protein [Pseudomonadota bacterium]